MKENPYAPPKSDIQKAPAKIPEALAKDIRNGFIAACISGSMTLLVTILAIFGTRLYEFSALNFIDVVIIFGLAFGIYKKSRIAATLMLIYFVVSKVLLLRETGLPLAGVIVAILLGYFYAKAMIATYKWQALNNSAN